MKQYEKRMTRNMKNYVALGPDLAAEPQYVLNIWEQYENTWKSCGNVKSHHSQVPPGTKAGIDRANTLSDFGTARTRLVRRWTQDEYKNDYAGLADEGGDFPNPLRTLYLDRSDPRPWVSGEVILSIGTLIGHHAKKYLNNNFCRCQRCEAEHFLLASPIFTSLGSK